MGPALLAHSILCHLSTCWSKLCVSGGCAGKKQECRGDADGMEESNGTTAASLTSQDLEHNPLRQGCSGVCIPVTCWHLPAGTMEQSWYRSRWTLLLFLPRELKLDKDINKLETEFLLLLSLKHACPQEHTTACRPNTVWAAQPDLCHHCTPCMTPEMPKAGTTVVKYTHHPYPTQRAMDVYYLQHTLSSSAPSTQGTAEP